MGKLLDLVGNKYGRLKCGQYGGKLNAHHIKAFRTNRDLRLEISNGITLCNSCHKKYHSKKLK